MRTLQVPRGGVTSLAYTSDSRSLLSGDASGAVYCWDLAAGASRRLFQLRGRNASDVVGLAVSPDGRLVAATSFEPCALWDVEAGAALPPMAGGPPVGWCLALSPDGRTLATRNSRGELALWDVPGGRQSRTLTGAGYWIVSSLCFAADGRSLIAAYDGEGVARVWDVQTGREFARLCHLGRLEVVAFSPAGNLLATGGGSSVVLWDPATWESRLSLKVGRAHVRRLAFHPAGGLLATAGDVPAVTLWDTATGRPLGRFDWQIGNVLALAFAPDGMTAAAGGSSRRLAVWDVDEAG